MMQLLIKDHTAVQASLTHAAMSLPSCDPCCLLTHLSYISETFDLHLIPMTHVPPFSYPLSNDPYLDPFDPHQRPI